MHESKTRDYDHDACERLANAIIMQAVDDYRKAIRKLKKTFSDPEKKKASDLSARNRIREVERFFRSDHYAALTSIDGEALIAKLKAEAGQSDTKGA
jgi:hypothetical protein